MIKQNGTENEEKRAIQTFSIMKTSYLTERSSLFFDQSKERIGRLTKNIARKTRGTQGWNRTQSTSEDAETQARDLAASSLRRLCSPIPTGIRDICCDRGCRMHFFSKSQGSKYQLCHKNRLHRHPPSRSRDRGMRQYLHLATASPFHDWDSEVHEGVAL